MLSLDFHHIALSVTDLTKSVAFYEQLGFYKVHHYTNLEGVYEITHLKLEEVILELFSYSDYQPLPSTAQAIDTDLPVVGTKHFALKTENIRATLKECIKLNIAPVDTKIKRGKTNIEYFFIKDPDGIQVEIIQDDRLL
jgi:glyoxylase I family protein